MITVGPSSPGTVTYLIIGLVLTSEFASLLAMEFNRNPVVNDEAAFDIYPPCVSMRYYVLQNF